MARAPRMVASVTASTGGLSKMIISAPSLIWLSRSFMRSEPSKSAGLGGRGPEGISFRPGTGVSTSAASTGSVSSSNRLVRPTWLGTPKNRCIAGRRRSVSARITRLPAWAMVIPRLQAVMVLPSSGPALVTSNWPEGLFRLENWTLVRRVRYASAMCERG